MKTLAVIRSLNTKKVRVVGLLGLGAAAATLTGLWANVGAAPAAAADAGAMEQAVTVIDKQTLHLSSATLADLGTVKAVTEDFPETLDIQGSISVVENAMTVVPSRVGNGRVDQVLKVSGDTVHAGDPLALIYSPDFVSAREEYLQVAGRNGISSGDLDGFAKEAREKLEIMGLGPKDIAELSKSSDNHLVVRASRDGVITSVNTMVGNLQNQGDTLFTTADLGKVWFSGDLYIEDLPKVRTGQKILVSAEGLDKPLQGTISFISPVVDPGVRTVKVRAIIENPDHLLRPSMFVQGSLVLNDAPALVVPQDAVLTLNDKTYCFKSLGGGRFQEVPVTVGREENTLAGIVGGLSNGDEIVLKDLDTLDHELDAARVEN
ncbi:MAG TPA: efflux RND transporter periplasmic adaptor subunit [bacterium]|jgi:Cu(I)/Ag(I) efflux system membrane fusion protein|nr:efflux RND transporter periplasmic adaptor subunit [bacterium]